MCVCGAGGRAGGGGYVTGISYGRLGFVIGRTAGGRFNPAAYLRRNPDARRPGGGGGGGGALDHYRATGWAEDRAPCVQ